MVNSTYDPCLLLTSSTSTLFGIVGMQTDDTLILGELDFLKKEEDEIKRVGFLTKPVQHLSDTESLAFNRCSISQKGDIVYMRWKGQGQRLELVDTTQGNYKQYLEQRARGAYLATICQPRRSRRLEKGGQRDQKSWIPYKTSTVPVRHRIACFQ
ncbi:hypothetical protein PZA11_005421 [Diplocarpon coronariae]